VILKLILYRILQERFKNAVKHAQPNHILLILMCRNRIVATIEDDGQGLSIPKKLKKKVIGVKNIASRLKKLNGVEH